MSAAQFQLGDRLYRVDGEWVGETLDEGVELSWQEWQADKITPAGAWFRCTSDHYRKRRFGLANGTRWGARNKREALRQLLARKRRHLAILAVQRS